MSIPSLPTLPTESLHKFLALTGLFLMIAPSVYLDIKLDDIGVRIIKLQTEEKIYELKSKEVERKLHEAEIEVYGGNGKKPKSIKQSLDSTRIANDKRYKIFEHKLKYFNKKQIVYSLDSAGRESDMEGVRIDSMDVKLNRYRRLESALELSSIKLNENAKLLQLENEKSIEYIRLVLASNIIGLIITTLGFVMWYKKENPPKEVASWRQKKRFE